MVSRFRLTWCTLVIEAICVIIVCHGINAIIFVIVEERQRGNDKL